MPKTTTPELDLLPFKVGADPELLLFYGDKHINAGQAIPKFLNGKYPTGTLGFNIGTHGNFGWDGSAPTAEIRPKESNDINVFVNNIGELFKAAHKEMPLFDLSTLSIGRPVGGHFHVDASAEFITNEKILGKVRKIIAALLIPILASEHKLSSTQRTKGGGYGELTDVRVHTDFQTFEIRGPSSEWLTSEKICRATSAYIAVIWNEIQKNHVALAKNDIMFKSLGQAKAMQDMIIADYKPLAHMMTDTIAKEIRKFELYEKYKEEVDFILNPKAVYKEKEAAGWNINNGWKLGGEKTPTKRDLNATTKIKEKVKEMNIELLTNTFSISYNDDYNVATFATGISERIATMNWSLKHEYFLFGLKKGTAGFIAAQAMQFTTNDGAKICYALPTNISRDESATALKNIANRVKGAMGSTIKINPKTGKAFSGVSNIVLIGIPYDIRADENLKPLINLMWEIENGKLKAKPIESFEVSVIAHKEENNTEEIISQTTSTQNGLTDEAQILATEMILEDYQRAEITTTATSTPESTDNSDNDDESACEICGSTSHSTEDCNN